MRCRLYNGKLMVPTSNEEAREMTAKHGSQFAADLLCDAVIEPDCILNTPERFHEVDVRYNGARLGDWIHAVANPIARAIDKIAGTDLQNCGGCEQRRNTLNSLT